MPPSTDTSPLARAIADYADVTVSRDASGRLVLLGDTPVSLICREVAQTRLLRRLTFFASDDICLDIVVRNGRVVAMYQAEASGAAVDFMTGSSDEAACLITLLHSVEKTGQPMSVQISRDARDFDPTATGLSPSLLLDTLKLTGKPSDALPDDPAMLKSFEDGPAAFKRWIEAANDQTFDEITFVTVRGSALTVRYTPDGSLRFAHRPRVHSG